MQLKSSLLLAAALCAAPLASAQHLLHGFSVFESPDTYFVGDWELNGDAGGTTAARATFSQGDGVYNFSGGLNDDASSAFFFYAASPGDLTGDSLLAVSAKLLAGNTASTFTVSLFDAFGGSAFAVFSTGDFNGNAFTTNLAAVNFQSGFDATNVSSFQISGGQVGGIDTLDFAVDALISTSSPTMIPEPSTYAAIIGALVLGLTGSRRFRRRA